MARVLCKSPPSSASECSRDSCRNFVAFIGFLIRAYAHAGRRQDAFQLLAELKRPSREGYVPTGGFVNAYLGLADYEQAFAWLEKGYQEQSNILQYLKVYPFFDPIRNDPRFADLLRRVGLRESSGSNHF